MKRTIYISALIASILFCQILKSQISGNLILNNRPPSYLSDWNNAATGQLILNNTGAGNIQNVKVSTSILLENGDVVGISNDATARIFTLTTGANIIPISAVLQLDNLKFNSLAKSLAQSGKLEPGNYQFCVQLITIDNQPLPFKQCRLFAQVNYQLPYLLTPPNGFLSDANTAQTAIIFRWSSMVPATQEASTYRLQVFEIATDQTPMQALRANQPILVTDLRRITQYIWRPQLSLKDSANHNFIWTVQTLDSQGIPIVTQDASANGRSEPSVFSICNKCSGLSKKPEIESLEK